MKLVFDIGMYDGSDTEYYLSEGFKVVAVEANPNLAERGRIKFSEQLSSGQLVIVNKAVCEDPSEEITLTISGDDLGSSSIFEDRIENKHPLGSYKVQATTIVDLIAEFGRPHFIKVDIEGADKQCVLPLDKANRPDYLSFESGDYLEELVHHLVAIGFSRFKAINQCNFFELSNQQTLVFRAKKKIIRLLGYQRPAYVRKNGRFFLLEHSAGPAPWCSDGKWQDATTLLSKWKTAASEDKLRCWYDIHAM